MQTPVSLSSLLAVAAESRQHLTELRSVSVPRLAAFRRNRAASEQAALEKRFHPSFLRPGGIADADIPGVISALCLRLLVFAAVSGLASSRWHGRTVRFPFCPWPASRRPCLLGMVTTLWRISILRHRRFTPLCRWLLHFRKRP